MATPTISHPQAKPTRPLNIVPASGFAASGLTAGASRPALSNHGGTVLQSVEVIPIYWGSAWGRGSDAALATELDGFFDFIVTSELNDMLAEYSLPGKPIQHGRRPNSVKTHDSRRTGDARPS